MGPFQEDLWHRLLVETNLATETGKGCLRLLPTVQAELVSKCSIQFSVDGGFMLTIRSGEAGHL